MQKAIYRLTLYVSGMTAEMEDVAERIRKWCADRDIALELAIKDVLEDCDDAIRHRVVATPVLIRHAPPPEQRVLGDFSEISEVFRLLGLPCK